MAAGTHLQVTSGTGPYVALGPTYTEAATTVADQKVILGEPYLPTYVSPFGALAIASGSPAHQWEMHAGASLNVRLRRIRFSQVAVGTAGVIVFALYRTTTAGIGSANSIASFNPADPSASAAVNNTITTPGTEGAALHFIVMPQGSAQPLTSCSFELLFGTDIPPLVIPAGTSNGLALRVISAPGGSATIAGFIEWAESAF